MATIEQLDKATLVQGDRIDYFQVRLSNRTLLDAGHPLATDGFLTAGYATTLVAKTNLNLADDGANVITSTLTPIDADSAQIDLLPSTTSGIDFGSRSELLYYWQIQISNGSDRIYTIARGSFTLLRDVAISP